MTINFPITVTAIPVEQQLGIYYVTVLPARVLLDVAFSDVLSASLNEKEDGYNLDGTQRLVQPARLQAIADYINRTDSAFPNSIILAANYQKENGLLADDEEQDESSDSENEETNTPKNLSNAKSLRWVVDEKDGHTTLTIPTKEKLAAIIDGQHRLFAFAKANPERLDMNLICSVFLDLPKPFQAHLFATINSTQKPVDKSLTYELFGYNIEEEEEIYWSPDKLAVFLTRRLGTDEKSPLRGRIVVAPKRDSALKRITESLDMKEKKEGKDGKDVKPWRVSTAVIVEGIMRLFTSNPKKDAANLLDNQRKPRNDLAQLRKDKSPLRDAYLTSGDAVIYTMVLNYLIACENLFWEKAKTESFIVKTVGVQALFDVLRTLSSESYFSKRISVAYFEEKLNPAKDIDFSNEEYVNASGSGRTAIKKAILEKIIIDPQIGIPL